jgi:hypothetical protein
MFRDFNDVFQSWIDTIEEVLKSKREKLNKPEFQKFDQNWLLIFDTPGLSNSSWDIEAARHLVGSLFQKPASVELDFDTVFILSGKCLFRHQSEIVDFHFDPELA